MLRSILRRARQFSRRIHVRVILFAVLNVLALLLATLLGPLIPQDFGRQIGADSVDTILQVIASSMLAVVIFSLTIMSNAFAQAAAQWTPRTHTLMREDTVTHSVLATFLGAYLYALIAIILRAADVFGEKEMVVLFGMTLLVVATIIVGIIRWILHLEGLGSLPETARWLEDRAAVSVRDAALYPAQKANRLTDRAAMIPKEASPIVAARAGYVQQVFEDALQDCAVSNEVDIYVAVPVGDYVQRGDVLAHVSGGAPDRDLSQTIRAAIPVKELRSLDQDPVYCVTVLAEVATRALSPGVNDPGTAIDVIHRLSHAIGEAREGPELDTPEHDRIWIEPLDFDALFFSSFDPIARCAGSAVEVHLAVQSALAAIIRVAGDGPLVGAARASALRCLDRANQALDRPSDRARLAAVTKAG